MRLLFACELFYPSVGGVQEVIRQVAARLVERGHRVTVATSHLEGRRGDIVDGVHIVPFRVSGNLVKGLRGEIDAYRQFVLRGDYDVFVVKAAQQWTFDALAPILDRMSKPKVFVPCGFSALYDPAFAEYYRGMPELMRKFDRLIFYASDYRDINMARASGLANLDIVPNGASEREFDVSRDPDFRRRHGIAEDAFVVLTVGLVNGLKGHRELAEAFAIADLPGREAVLVLNGNKPTHPPLSHRVANLPATLRAHYRAGGVRVALAWILRALLQRGHMGGLAPFSDAGPPLEVLVARINQSISAKRAILTDLPRDELVQAYLNSDLFAFASRIEYSPLVLYESAAAGLPFLSVPVGNAEEIAQWTGAGEICPAPKDSRGYTRADPGVLAGCLQALAADPDKRKALGAAGRRNWLERFTWAKITDRYEAVFSRLISEKADDAGADSRSMAGEPPGAGQ